MQRKLKVIYLLIFYYSKIQNKQFDAFEFAHFVRYQNYNYFSYLSHSILLEKKMSQNYQNQNLAYQRKRFAEYEKHSNERKRSGDVLKMNLNCTNDGDLGHVKKTFYLVREATMKHWPK